jgi:hypothetical protein
MLFLRDHDFVTYSHYWRPAIVIHWRLEIGIDLLHLQD